MAGNAVVLKAACTAAAALAIVCAKKPSLPRSGSTAGGSPRPRFSLAPAPVLVGEAAGTTTPLVWLAECPGRDRDGSATPYDLNVWCDHLRCRGIQRMLCLLGAEPLAEKYTELLPEGSLQAACERRGLGWDSVVYDRDEPLVSHLSAALQVLLDAQRDGETVVISCSRQPLASAVVVAWLCARGREPFAGALARLEQAAAAEGVRWRPLDAGAEDLKAACATLGEEIQPTRPRHRPAFHRAPSADGGLIDSRAMASGVSDNPRGPCIICRQNNRSDKTYPITFLAENDLFLIHHRTFELKGVQRAPLPGWLMFHAKRHTHGPATMNNAEAGCIMYAMRYIEQILIEVTGAERIYTVMIGETGPRKLFLFHQKKHGCSACHLPC